MTGASEGCRRPVRPGRILNRSVPLDVAFTCGHILVVLGFTAFRVLLCGDRLGDPWILAGGLLFHVGALFFFLLGPRRMPLRAISHVVYYSTAYGVLALYIPALGIGDHGLTLRRIEAAFFGCQPAEQLHRLFPPFCHEVFAVGYSLFIPYLYFNVIRSIVRDDPRTLKRFLVGFTALYAIGYFGYVFFPASGPRFFDDQYAGGAAFTAITDGPFLSRHLSAFMDDYSGHQNVFPSLHAAVTLYALLFEFRYRSWIVAWLSLPLVLGVWIGTVYQGYHYVVDLVGGLVLVAIAMGLAAVAVRMPGD